jgi:hypothetical protein
MRGAVALLLALVLALSSVTMAQARHMPRAAGAAVLCTAAGVVAVAVDAQGNPVGPMLPCPDCIAAAHALTPAPAPLPAPAQRLVGLAPVPAAAQAAPRTALRHRHARAPPATV